MRVALTSLDARELVEPDRGRIFMEGALPNVLFPLLVIVLLLGGGWPRAGAAVFPAVERGGLITSLGAGFSWSFSSLSCAS